MAEDKSHNPPPIPKTPYSAGEPPEKTFIKAIIKPNIPPRKNTQTMIFRSVLSISFSAVLQLDTSQNLQML
jgi:hypothetical protein